MVLNLCLNPVSRRCDPMEACAQGASLMGIGWSYAITPNVEFSLQYQGAVYIIVGYGAVTAGITYHL